MYKWTPIMSTVMETATTTSNPSAPATRTISTKLPRTTMAGWRQHLVTPGYSCLATYAKWDEKWGYDYTGSSSTTHTTARLCRLISMAVASVVRQRRVDLRCPDGNLVVIAKPGRIRCLRRIRQPMPDATLLLLSGLQPLPKVGRIRCLRRIGIKTALRGESPSDYRV